MTEETGEEDRLFTRIVDEAIKNIFDQHLSPKQFRGLIEHFEGGPVGLNTLAVAVGEDAGTLEEVYEPFLIQNGFLMRTPRGRQATNRAFQRFGYALPASRTGLSEPQVNLFEG